MSRRRARLSAALICARVSVAADAGSGGFGQQLQGVSGVQVLERFHRGGEVVTQRVAQPLGVPGALPDQRLVRSGHHLDRLALGAVTGDRAELVGVGADHVGQHVRVGGVALGARHRVPLPVAGRLQRVDREHLVPGRDQRRDPRAPVGLDPDQHLDVLGVLTSQLTNDRVQPCDPRHALGQARSGQPPARSVQHLHVVMVLSPVVSHQQPHVASHPRSGRPSAAWRESVGDLMKQCSRPTGQARHPSSDQHSRPTGRATISHQASRARRTKCSPAGGYQARVCRMATHNTH